MISYAVYKVVHLLGILMVFLALGGVTMHAISGGGKDHSWWRPAAITHGIGMVLALVGGFGLLARLGVVHGTLPVWVIAKLGIWLIFGALLGVVIRKKTLAKPIWFATLFLGVVAAYLAGSKPF
ncbi:MAG: hypothetical protein AB7N80_06965 [Bdellovibrionales bacterium]